MKKSLIEFYTRLAHGLAVQFGSNCEVVVHDLQGKDIEHSIIAIENGHVTGRRIGDGPSQIVLESLHNSEQNLKQEDKLAYLTKTKNGKILKSSTIFIRDDSDKIIGIFGINYDISLMLAMEKELSSFTGTIEEDTTKEPIAVNIGDLLDELITQSVQHIGKPVTLMSKEDKVQVVRLLNEAGAFTFSMFSDLTTEEYPSISEVLETFYAQKEVVTRIRQKSVDLRHIVQNALERTAKKYDLQLKQLKDTDKKEKYKIYGELLHTYGYEAAPHQKELKCINYYDGKEITIPLDPDLNAMENAKKYFDRYGKLKRTYEALSTLTKETFAELSHLESVSNALEIARDENDLAMIKEELIECGYMKRHGRNQKKRQGKSKPLHYISSDGFHMYVGKNNFQNDELSFKFANGKDMWFHAKKMAGSHVIVKLGTVNELPDRTYEEAARLAAHYSKGKNAPKVEVDYTERRNLKKPPQAKPGYVIYHTNYSMLIDPDISGIKEISDL